MNILIINDNGLRPEMPSPMETRAGVNSEGLIAVRTHAGHFTTVT
jgi:hypothetical protein